MNITLRKLCVDDADWTPQPVEIDAGTPEELEGHLFDYLASGKAEQVVEFGGDYDFRGCQRFMKWLAARPVVDVQGDEQYLELVFGFGSYRGPGWDEPYEPTIIVHPDVGTDTGHRIGIGGMAYALLRRPDGSYLLFNPQPSRVIATEYWDNNGWGDATRVLAVRNDGLLETSCVFMEGMPSAHELLPPADSDEQIAQAVIRFNRSDEGPFSMDIVEGKVFHQLLDRYLFDDDIEPQDIGVLVSADYKLTASQRAAARDFIQMERR